MMCAMSPSKDTKRPSGTARSRKDSGTEKSEGVLSQLPRTRPQRSSPRRAAARRASATALEATATPARSNGRPPSQPGEAANQPREAVKAKKVAPKRAAKRPAKSSAKPLVAAEPAPRQGFECEGERTNSSVHPPGGTELVASAAEIVGEIAKAGILTGERLLKDVLSRLPLS
jgi:hypothetical protein